MSKDISISEYIAKYTDDATKKLLAELAASGITFYDTLQIQWIKRGVDGGFPMEAVRFYAKPEFDANLMSVFYYVFKYHDDLTVEQVEAIYDRYSDGLLDYCELSLIFDSVSHKFNDEQIEFIQDCYRRGTHGHEGGYRIRSILKAIDSGLSFDNVRKFISPQSDVPAIKQLTKAIAAGVTDEDADKYFSSSYTALQFEYVSVGLIGPYKNSRHNYKGRYSQEQLELYAKPEFKSNQMREIMLGIEHGLPIERIKLYALSKYHYIQMRAIRKGLESMEAPESMEALESTKNYLFVLRSSPLSIPQVEGIERGYELGLDPSQLCRFVDNRRRWSKRDVEQELNKMFNNRVEEEFNKGVEENEHTSNLSTTVDPSDSPVEQIMRLISASAKTFSGSEKQAIVNALLFSNYREGNWVKSADQYSYWYSCSCCGCKPAKTEWGNDYFSPFCSECGAIMLNYKTVGN